MRKRTANIHLIKKSGGARLYGKEALIVDQLFTAFSQSLHILQSALIEEDGEYTFDQDLAEKAGAGKEAKLCAGFFNSLPQELLEGIYTAFHPAE